MGFNIVDIIILVISALFIFKSYKKGFTGEVFGLLAILFAFALSIKLNPVLSKFARKFVNSDNAASILGFIVSFIILNIIIRKIGSTIKKFLDTLQLGWLDSLAGAAIGGVKALVVSMILIMGLKLMPFGAVNKTLQKSQLAPHLEKISGSFYSSLKKNFPKELNKRFKNIPLVSRNFFSN